MKNEELTQKFADIQNKLDQLSMKTSDDTGRKLIEIQGDVNSAETCFDNIKTPSLKLGEFFISVGIGILCVLLASVVFAPDSEYPDFPEYDYHHGLYVGDIVATNPDYVRVFNETFIGYITHLNATNCSDDNILVTFKNRDREIVLNEFWVVRADEDWFRDQYDVDFNRLPDHYIDYNGTYQFFSDVSEDWNIIHTENGKIRHLYYSPEDKHKWYYYNNTHHGGVDVEYNDLVFTIIHTGEEIEYKVIL